MRKCIVISVRTLTVFVLVAGLPLMALPPVRTHVGNWMEDARQRKRLKWEFAKIGVLDRASPDVEPVDEEGTQWQAEPVVSSSHKPGPLNLAMGNPEHTPRSSRKSNLPPNETPAATEPPPEVDAASRIRQIRRNLIKLGAQNIRLDEAAGYPAEYHFSCSMPLGNRAVYSRKFAIRDSDPIRAMTRVLDEVERWRESFSSL